MNCVSASGTPLAADARNTAVPGSRACHPLVAVSIRSASGWRKLRRAPSTSLAPLRQVSITNATAPASTSGNQPPSSCACRKPNPAGTSGRIAQCFCLMREAYSLVWSVLVLLFRSRVSLEAEILILRHQLNIQRRHVPKRVAFSAMDRLIFVGLYRLVPNTIKALTIVKPGTVIRWHRAGFRSYWRWKSRHRCGRPTVPLEIRRLIREMSIANPLWGAPRIHGELLKLGIEIGQTSVAKY